MSVARLAEIDSLRNAIDKEVSMGDQEIEQARTSWLDRRLKLRQQREALSKERDQLIATGALVKEMDGIAKAKAEAQSNVEATQKDREEVAAMKAELASLLAKAKEASPVPQA